MERPTLRVTTRTEQGRRAVRRMRRGGVIPGVLYGKQTAPTAVLVSQRDLAKFLRARGGEHGLLTLHVEADDHKAWEKPVLIKAIQHDPVIGGVLHVDFHAITLTERIRIKIPIVLKGEPAGVKQESGILEHFLRELEVECLPTEIPRELVHDISALKIGDGVHVRDLEAPAGARIMSDPEGVVASVLAPKAEKVEEAAEAVSEPEVIREKKPEADTAAAEGKPEGKKEDAKKDEKK